MIGIAWQQASIPRPQEQLRQHRGEQQASKAKQKAGQKAHLEELKGRLTRGPVALSPHRVWGPAMQLFPAYRSGALLPLKAAAGITVLHTNTSTEILTQFTVGVVPKKRQKCDCSRPKRSLVAKTCCLNCNASMQADVKTLAQIWWSLSCCWLLHCIAWDCRHEQ